MNSKTSIALCAMCFVLAWVLASGTALAQGERVDVVKVVADSNGQRLQVNGEDFLVLGMNWDYFPIGTNYTYSLWTQPDDIIISALATEMELLQGMGVNAIRLYNGIQPRWVEYIYDNYGIFTVLNHPMARYGYTINGTWIPAPAIDYSSEPLREAVTAEIVSIVEEFKDTRGILMWMLGNENNYQLSWSSTEIEALPEGERQSARARHLYSLYNKVAEAIKEVDTLRPISMVNGDLQYIDLIAEECDAIDIFGTNVYRGISARGLYQEVAEKLNKPVFYAEFGCDAWNAKEMREDQTMQCRYLVGQWQEIYEQSAGKGRVGNCIGGLTFQWSDGWWKFQQETRLDIHDTNASWPNGGYTEDFVEGANNMNEEWWGVVAKGRPDFRGLFELYPRAAYYALQEAYELDPFAPATDLEAIREHFSQIQPSVAALKARGDRAALLGSDASKVRVSGVRMEFETFGTGGDNITTPAVDDERTAAESFRGFDRLESFYIDVEANPAPAVQGRLSVNVLGNVPRNPIDEVFYENRGRSPQLLSTGINEFVPDLPETTAIELPGIERVKVYNASVSWDDDYFRLDGFYRTGHTHWGYEGDFFGFYQEAFYGENIDIYNGVAPVGVEIAGKRAFNGWKFAFGSELWWGANPAFLLKYQRRLLGMTATAVYQEDFAKRPNAVVTSSAIPERDNRKASIMFERPLGPFGMEIGGIWSGSTEIDEDFDGARESGDSYELYTDSVDPLDTLGAKAKLTWQKGRWNWYGQGAVQGLVAAGGYNRNLNYTGWALRDPGTGNQRHLVTGLTMQVADWQIGPNFLWQKPLEDPIPRELLLTDRRNQVPLATGLGSRSVLNSPFQVRGNRETVGAEVVLTYDSTPATWMWQWDNDVREDAPLAASLRYTFRHQPTTQDASVFVSSGGSVFAFGGAPAAKDLWDVHLRVVSRINANSRLVLNTYGGPSQPNGSYFDDGADINRQVDRITKRFGTDLRYIRNSLSFAGSVKVNDWGPYDYHRDFNLTYPLQLIGDLSYTLGAPRWFADSPQTRVGVRAAWRSLDENSPRYEPEVDLTSDDDENGREWEIRTYLHFAL